MCASVLLSFTALKRTDEERKAFLQIEFILLKSERQWTNLLILNIIIFKSRSILTLSPEMGFRVMGNYMFSHHYFSLPLSHFGKWKIQWKRSRGKWMWFPFEREIKHNLFSPWLIGWQWGASGLNGMAIWKTYNGYMENWEEKCLTLRKTYNILQHENYTHVNH